MDTPAPLHVVFVIFPRVMQLDFVGPHEVLRFVPGARCVLASSAGGTVAADGGLEFGTLPLAEVQACDIVCVPGGSGVTEAMLDEVLLRELRRLAAMSRHVASVCTGSLVLAAAGLLQGRRAACHWLWRDMLARFPGVTPDGARVVRDGNVITGGGVTAGIDLALTLAAEIGGEELARGIQLGIEYAPAPPFDSGRPETAGAALVERARRSRAAARQARELAAQRAVAALRGG